jgi:hypothetical protein
VLRADYSALLDEAAPGSSSTGAAGLACLYCTGNDTATLNRFMIGCDKCEMWYHGPCVGVGKAAADAMDDYRCPECCTAAQAAYAFGPPLPMPKFTRRPRLRYVASLLAEAEEVGLEIPEAALIGKLHEQSEAWQAKALEFLDDDVSLDPSQVDALMQEGDACEVEPEALQLLRKSRAALSTWLVKALAVLNGECDVDAPLLEEEADLEREIAERAARPPGQSPLAAPRSAKPSNGGGSAMDVDEKLEEKLEEKVEKVEEKVEKVEEKVAEKVEKVEEKPPAGAVLSEGAQRRSTDVDELEASEPQP